jgi:hypothetical protein
MCYLVGADLGLRKFLYVAAPALFLNYRAGLADVAECNARPPPHDSEAIPRASGTTFESLPHCTRYNCARR